MKTKRSLKNLEALSKKVDTNGGLVVGIEDSRAEAVNVNERPNRQINRVTSAVLPTLGSPKTMTLQADSLRHQFVSIRKTADERSAAARQRVTTFGWNDFGSEGKGNWGCEREKEILVSTDPRVAIHSAHWPHDCLEEL